MAYEAQRGDLMFLNINGLECSYRNFFGRRGACLNLYRHVRAHFFFKQKSRLTNLSQSCT